MSMEAKDLPDGREPSEHAGSGASDAAVLRRRSHALSRLLAELDPDPADVEASAAAIRPLLDAPTRARLPRLALLRVAASIVILLGLTLAVPQARAWVAERARDVAQALGLVQPSPAAIEDADVRVAFPVAGTRFDLELRDVRATLLVRTGAGALGAAEAVGAPDVRLLVLPRGLRIQGPAPDGATLRITLPPHVTRLHVRVDDGEPMAYSVPAEGRELRIEWR